MKPKRATIRTIAQEAGVAANTVSLALRGSNLVSAATRERVLGIAQAQAYIPNVLAESLRSGRSRTVALIFGNLFNPLFAIKTQKIEHALRMQGYQVLILNSNEDAQQELDVVQTAIGRKVDGVVLCPSMRSRTPLDILRKHSVPCVLVGRSFPEMDEDAVVWDNERGAFLATQYLVRQGCSRILHIGGASHVSASQERLRGYVRALEEAGIGLEEKLVLLPSALGSGYVEALRALDGTYDGVFAFSDLMLWEAACYIDRPVHMVGFDNIRSFFPTPLRYPSIAANIDEETRVITDLLLSRIDNHNIQARKVVLPVHLTLP